MLKKVRKKQQMVVNGGSHYHWICRLNCYQSARYNDINKCYAAMKQHVQKYPHGNYVSVITCNGNCD